ncbi:hypothetical protein Gorai_008011 [Gossypium raimondii]|uniref:Uncharacterized protein n=1 Tax=Gossypium raimondii TaxID=29730 RepID=A0A7J8Q9W2_GOSRA|nr:hypothetical protein [Gossypium raimondii]
MEVNLAALSLEGGEDDAWHIPSAEGANAINTGLCLVGSFLIASDLSIKAIPRQAWVATRCWLREEGETTLVRDSTKVGVVLGINLDGRSEEVWETYDAGNPHNPTVVKDCPLAIGGLPLQSREVDYNEDPYLDVRGLGSPRAMHCLRQVLRETNPIVAYFMETKLQSRVWRNNKRVGGMFMVWTWVVMALGVVC